MPHWLPDAFIVAVLVVAFVVASRVKDDDPAWAERWKALSPSDRTRIAAAAPTSPATARSDRLNAQ